MRAPTSVAPFPDVVPLVPAIKPQVAFFEQWDRWKEASAVWSFCAQPTGSVILMPNEMTSDDGRGVPRHGWAGDKCL
jgi:hypothetical protein